MTLPVEYFSFVHIQTISSAKLEAIIFTEWQITYEEIIIFFLSITVNNLFYTPDGYGLVFRSKLMFWVIFLVVS